MRKKSSTPKEKKLQRNPGAGKKLIPHAPGVTRGLNDLIKKSDYDVITQRNSQGGKYLSFKETVTQWEEGAISDCKDSQDRDSCEIDMIQENQPEYCLMGNPRSCLGKSTLKKLRESQSGREVFDKVKSDEEYYLSQFDNMTPEEIDALSNEIMLEEEEPF